MTTRAVLGVCVALTLSGCSGLDNCPDASSTAIEVPVPEGDAEAGPADGTPSVYESSSWEGDRMAFPAKTCMRFKHGLGTTPEIVNTYVSFERRGSDVTENAGNQGRIKCVDSQEIVIKNDTCEEDFYIRVVAYASGSGGDSTDCQTLKDDDCTLP